MHGTRPIQKSRVTVRVLGDIADTVSGPPLCVTLSKCRPDFLFKLFKKFFRQTSEAKNGLNLE